MGKTNAEENPESFSQESYSEEDHNDLDYNFGFSKESFNNTLTSIDESISRIRFQLQAPVEDTAKGTLRKMNRKLTRRS